MLKMGGNVLFIFLLLVSSLPEITHRYVRTGRPVKQFNPILHTVKPTGFDSIRGKWIFCPFWHFSPPSCLILVRVSAACKVTVGGPHLGAQGPELDKVLLTTIPT